MGARFAQTFPCLIGDVAVRVDDSQNLLFRFGRVSPLLFNIRDTVAILTPDMAAMSLMESTFFLSSMKPVPP